MNPQKITNPQKIAVLGLGAMGSRIAKNLIAAGYPVTVWNRSPQATQGLAAQGATVATSPKQAAEQADVIISLLTDNEASKAVWLAPKTGALWGLTAGAIAIECSTLTVEWTQTLGAAIARQDADFLAAPVVGSRPQAEAQKLICFVGGHAKTFEQVQEILSATAGAVHHIGDIGQAMAMKLAVNSLFGIQVTALAEALGMLIKYGLSGEQAMTCLGELPVISPAAIGAGKLMVAQKHAPQFPISLVEKDFRYALASAQAVEAGLPSAETACHTYQKVAETHGHKNITSVAHLFF